MKYEVLLCFGLPCSIHVPDSLFPQSLSRFSFVYLLAWHPTLHTPYIFSPNHCLLFTTHAHTVTACNLGTTAKQYEVEGSRPRGRPKKTWKEIVEKDCQACELNREDAVDYIRWMKQIRDD